MIRLGVNIDHIANVRQARGETFPDPLKAAMLLEQYGADNITCHLREDRRHIQDNDVIKLKQFLNVPLNLEIANTPEMIEFASKIKPHYVCIVPEKREELTTEGGLNLSKNMKSLKDSIVRLKEANCFVSMFVEANQKDIELCKQLDADAVEIHTGKFAANFTLARNYIEIKHCLQPLLNSARTANSLGIDLHLGHGINYQNAGWIQLVPHTKEVNIGFAIVARSIFVGLSAAFVQMRNLLNDSQWKPVERI